VHAVRERTGAAVEVLVSDFEGNRDAVRTVLASEPEVFAHNIETVPRLYSAVRPVAKYQRSLDVLRWAGEECTAGMLTKSSLMLGLGEREEEILAVARDLRDAGVDIFTMGQYLAPTGNHHPVRRYWTPEEFATLGQKALELGFRHVESAPLVRSSYMAHRALGSSSIIRHGSSEEESCG
ncbi:MAG TPA: lipoyl synthase, partial [Thermoanaerobaculia bacterium]